MDTEKVLDLAKLARIEVGAAEAEKLSQDIGSILGYVGEIKEISTSGSEPEKADLPVRNVMRADAEPHQSGLYTAKILEQAPERDGDYLKVKKIL